MIQVLVASHAIVGALFLGALVGRWIVLGLAERATSLIAIRALTQAAVPFERTVIVSSLLVLVLGIMTAIAQGRPFLGPLQGAPVDWLFTSFVLYLTIVPLVPFVFVPRGRLLDAALEEAIARDVITPELIAAFRDPMVRAAHVYELAVVTIVFALMVGKPF